jgi:2-oxoglutarate ferredoxin oxidoreductase subunit alpha
MGKDLIVRFAGEGGQGVVTAADSLAQAASRVGYHVQTFSTFPSQIKGGPTLAQTRVSTEEVLSPGDDLDILVALNRYAFDNNVEELREGGILIYNSEEFELEPGEYTGPAFGMEMDKLARSTGNQLAVNMVMIGAVAQLASMPESYFSDFVTVRFSRGRASDQAIIDANIKALELGYEAARVSGFEVESLDEPPVSEEQRVLITGFQSISMGAIAGGLDSFIGYPISPATTTLVFMEQNLHGDDKFVGQASSEIETINALIGAGFGGKTTMTSTAGPGLSLMGEGLGLAWIAEIPLVVLDVQRGGPATGLPTKTEQSDLLAALNPGHGDMRLPVIAPGTVDECFWAGAHAIAWAERYQGPVIVLSEAQIAERTQDIVRPDTSKVVVERRVVSTGENGNLRYAGDGVTPFPVPGGPGAYVANGSEHDDQGDTTHLPRVHVEKTERRFNKLKLLEDGTYESDNTSASIAIMPWGGSKGASLNAYRVLREQGVDVSWYYTMYISPFPPAMLEELRSKDLVIVPELNYLGQMSMVLRGHGVNAESITQYTGLPFKVRDLVERISQRAGAGSERLATV